jgi:hypothetical protein
MTPDPLFSKAWFIRTSAGGLVSGSFAVLAQWVWRIVVPQNWEVVRVIGVAVILILSLICGTLIAIYGWPGRGRRIHSDDAQTTTEPSDGAGLQQEPEVASDPPSSRSSANQPESDIQAWAEEARKWEYRYLGLFLAPDTQHLLDWFYNRKGPVTVGTYDQDWGQRVSNRDQRMVMLKALHNHFLIEVNDHTLWITDKGREYVEQRGPYDVERELQTKRAFIIAAYKQMEAEGLVPSREQRENLSVEPAYKEVLYCKLEKLRSEAKESCEWIKNHYKGKSKPVPTVVSLAMPKRIVGHLVAFNRLVEDTPWAELAIPKDFVAGIPINLDRETHTEVVELKLLPAIDKVIARLN